MGLNPYNMDNIGNLIAVVDIYNQTPHTGLPLFYDPAIKMKRNLTPLEMTLNPDLEWKYIRLKDRELRDIQQNIREHGFQVYEPENVLKLYLSRGKTHRRFQKRRLNFENIGVFIGYHNGNARCYVLHSGRGIHGTSNASGTQYGEGTDEVKDVPLFYTRYLARDIDALDPKIRKYFGINVSKEEIRKRINELEKENSKDEYENEEDENEEEEEEQDKHEEEETKAENQETTNEETLTIEDSGTDFGTTTEQSRNESDNEEPGGVSDQQVAQDIANDTNSGLV